MNLLHISGKKDWGGGENQLLLTLKGLQNYENINQFFLCPTGSDIYFKVKENLKEIKVYSSKKEINMDLRFMYSIFSIVKKEKINTIHVHDPDAHTLVVIAIDLFRLKVNVVLHKKTIFPLRKKKLTLYKYNHKSIKHIVCVSKASSDVMKEGITKIPISVVYDAIEIEDDTPNFSRNNEVFTVLNVANHTEFKNLFTLLEIAHQCIYVHKLPFKFIQIGHGGLTQELIQKRDELQLQDYFEFKGFLAYVYSYYQTSNVFLFTSAKEGLGVSLLEAIKFKLPIVSSNVGGISELVEHNINGLLCDFDDVDCYVENLKKIYNSNELADNFTQVAYEKVKNEFSLQVMCDKLMDIYIQK
jgi:glycosyltransferase involved in cell wall biosynthesis